MHATLAIPVEGTMDYKAVVFSLRRGAVMLYPTETIYGLGCDARNTKALARICALKGRPKGKPFIVLVRDLRMAKRVAYFSEKAEQLAKRFWPGPLTLVLPLRQRALPARYFGKTIALRVSPHPFARALFRHAEFLLISTSANRSGSPPAHSVGQLKRQFGARIKKIDIIIDAGVLPRRMSSTVVDLTEGTPKLLREGATPWKTIVRRNLKRSATR